MVGCGNTALCTVHMDGSVQHTYLYLQSKSIHVIIKQNLSNCLRLVVADILFQLDYYTIQILISLFHNKFIDNPATDSQNASSIREIRLILVDIRVLK